MRKLKVNTLIATIGLLTLGYTGQASAHQRHAHHHGSRYASSHVYRHVSHRRRGYYHTYQQQDAVTTPTTQDVSVISTITSQTRNLSPAALKVGLTAYSNARARGLDSKKLLTIIDYSAPSTSKRMWVIDVARKKVLYNTLVAHGKNSGDNYATNFSNSPSSNESSLGVFLTGSTYTGHHGVSMRLMGLERGFNSNAYSRAIVMHSADYVNDETANQLGRLGRSWGCPALDPRVEPQVVNTIKNGTLIVAYYPSKEWLNHSQFLRPVNGTMLA